MRLFRRIGVFFIFIALSGKIKTQAQNPSIVTNDVSGATACAGTTVSVSFVASNLINPSKRLFTVQLSNSGGTFTNPTPLSTGQKSPITVTVPASVLGGDYRLRVVTDTTGVTYTPSAVFMVLKPPTATLAGDTTINIGGSATLSLFFTGNGPWTYTFTNTNTGTTSSNPLRGIVQPTVTTAYALQSVSNICGPGTVSGSAKVTVIPRITADFATGSICAGASTTVPFTLTGAFGTTGITYTAQLSNAAGSFSAPTTIGTGTNSPISVVLPGNLVAGTGYRIRVIANAPAASVETNAITVKALPSAVLSVNATIIAGESTNLTVTLTGEAPWTYKLSNNQTFNAASTPASAGVTPSVTTTYTLLSVSNACGNGTVSGSALITVLPRISVADVALGSVCTGTNVSLPFVVTGAFETSVTYTAQLSDGTGSFTAPISLKTGNASPLDITIPPNLPAGTGYRLRVTANAAASSVNSPAFAIKVKPTAVISGNPTVNFGETAALSLSFTGEGPWNFGLSDGTTGTADRTPFTVNVKPTQTSAYLVSSVRNLCGEGSTSGSGTVTVIPRLLTENVSSAVCAGKEVEVKFSIGGTLSSNTAFQVQLSDSTGNFANAVTVGSGSRSPLTALIPSTTLPGSNYRLQVIVAGNPSITTTPGAPFFLGRLPTATLSGGSNFPIKPGEEVFLIIQFSGDAPWNYVLSDNTAGSATASPVIITIAPLLPTTYTLKSVSNTCGAGTVSGSAIANVIITSIESLEEEAVIVSPNPFTERLKIKIALSNASEWQLTDLQGRLWQYHHWSGVSYEEVINTQQLPAGTYIFRVKAGEKWFSKTLIKE
ncbi:MAG: T9SS type A sorting domain-containing protein [Spirosomataceae bacterium]